MVVKHAVLLGLAQARHQWQHFGAAQHGAVAQVLAQVVGRFADFTLAGQENKNVSAVLRIAPQFIHRIGNGGVEIGFLAFFKRPVADFDWKQPPRHQKYWRVAFGAGKVLRKPVGVDRG